MKRTINLSLALCALTLMSIVSCRKSYNSQGSGVTDISGLNNLFSDLRTTPQSFNVTAGTDATVTGAGGTKMHFYPNSFKDANGNVITSGTVNLQLTEMYKPGDMIANRASTMAGGRILQSGGQVNLTATINGKQVYSNGFGMQFKQSAASTVPMNLFYGTTQNADSITTWAIGADSTRTGTVAWETTTAGSGDITYIFDSCSHFGWTNCDQFYNCDTLTSVGVILPNSTFNPANTQVYLVLPDILSVMSSVEPNFLSLPLDLYTTV